MNKSNKIGFHNLNLTAQYMPRPRLDEIFNQATWNGLVYLVAGAGYGKTQAVRHYVHGQKNAVAWWMSISENDNTPSRFWESLTRTVSADNPDLATTLQELGFPETVTGFKQFLKAMRSAKSRTHKTFLVLDDFHLIHSKEVLNFVELCSHLKISGVSVMILSRKEPEINIAALFSKGDISMITEAELRFTPAEAAKFFKQHSISLSERELSQLMQKTAGWVLALSMFVLILNKIPNRFEYALDSLKQNIFKLLDVEVWSDFPKKIQKLLVKLSLLSDLPPMSLQEALGNSEILKKVPELTSFIKFHTLTNSFTIHPFYLEFLQSKHSILSHEEEQETFRWAAKWCSENDFYVDAMHYYAKSYQFERMIKAFLSHPFKLPSNVSKYFLDILRNLNAENVESNDLNVLFLKSCFIPLLLVGMGNYENAKEEALAVIHKWEQADTPLSNTLLYTAYSNLAYINMYTCTATHKYNFPEYLKKAVDYFKRSSIASATTRGTYVNADVRSFACLIGEGASLSEFDQFLDIIRQSEIYIAETPHNMHYGYGDILACEYAFFKNQPELASSYAYNAILKAREKKQYSIVALAEKYLLRIATQTGDASLAKTMLKQLSSHLDNIKFWNRQLYFDLYTGLFYATIGRPELVPKWLVMDENGIESQISIPTRELIVSAWYYISSKKYRQALTVLCSAHPREPQERFYFGELRLLLLTAVARVRTGDTEGAMSDFEKAYELSFQGVFELFFIELGKELNPLVVAALKCKDCNIPEKWLNAINRKALIYAKKTVVVANAFKDEANIEELISLSKRELEALTDLYHGLSREEIAENRHLSIHTVKKTLQSAYIKLGAHNNVDAVRIALERKLIE